MAESLHCQEELEAVASELIAGFSFVDHANETVSVSERCRVLLEMECLYKVEDYASRQATVTVSTSWRRRIVEWLYQVSSLRKRMRGLISRLWPRPSAHAPPIYIFLCMFWHLDVY